MKNASRVSEQGWRGKGSECSFPPLSKRSLGDTSGRCQIRKGLWCRQPSFVLWSEKTLPVLFPNHGKGKLSSVRMEQVGVRRGFKGLAKGKKSGV